MKQFGEKTRSCNSVYDYLEIYELITIANRSCIDKSERYARNRDRYCEFLPLEDIATLHSVFYFLSRIVGVKSYHG